MTDRCKRCGYAGELRVRIDHDDSLSPCDEDGWQLYSFSSRHYNYASPESLGLGEELDASRITPVVEDEDLQRKLDAGLAFFLSYYEHGNCVWSMQGSGRQCQWDSVSIAGLLVWNQKEDSIGPRTFEERQADAIGFLKTYTAWCNGEVYTYSVINEEGDTEDSCGGFYDTAEMFKEIATLVGDRTVIFEGDAASLAEYHWKEEVI